MICQISHFRDTVLHLMLTQGLSRRSFATSTPLKGMHIDLCAKCLLNKVFSSVCLEKPTFFIKKLPSNFLQVIGGLEVLTDDKEGIYEQAWQPDTLEGYNWLQIELDESKMVRQVHIRMRFVTLFQIQVKFEMYYLT